MEVWDTDVQQILNFTPQTLKLREICPKIDISNVTSEWKAQMTILNSNWEGDFFYFS